jgi:hypothetical protein
LIYENVPYWQVQHVGPAQNTARLHDWCIATETMHDWMHSPGNNARLNEFTVRPMSHMYCTSQVYKNVIRAQMFLNWHLHRQQKNLGQNLHWSPSDHGGRHPQNIWLIAQRSELTTSYMNWSPSDHVGHNLKIIWIWSPSDHVGHNLQTIWIDRPAIMMVAIPRLY